MSMIKEWIRELSTMNPDTIQQALESYSAYGPLPGIAAPLLEALLPFLPLLLIIAANANIYGLGPGIIYSWLGVSLGCILLFWIARKLGGRFGAWLQRRYPATARFFHWIERKGFTPIFLLACLPFSPSSLINIASGLSTVPFRTFLLAVTLGKGVMIICVSLLSFNITNLWDEPWRILLAVGVMLLMWYGGRRLERRYSF